MFCFNAAKRIDFLTFRWNFTPRSPWSRSIGRMVSSRRQRKTTWTCRRSSKSCSCRPKLSITCHQLCEEGGASLCRLDHRGRPDLATPQHRPPTSPTYLRRPSWHIFSRYENVTPTANAIRVLFLKSFRIFLSLSISRSAFHSLFSFVNYGISEMFWQRDAAITDTKECRHSTNGRIIYLIY